MGYHLIAKTYKMAGVDIDTGNQLVDRIRNEVRSTFDQNVLSDIGSFGALYDARFPEITDPVLVSSVDGVGTKLKVAFLMDRHESIGQDLVNHCVNDIAVIGARPLFFLDYFAAGKLKSHVTQTVISGMVKACRENSCSLIGGETAEMPGFYRDNEYDIAGMVVGVVDKKKLFDGKRVKSSDVLIGLPSTGLHTNGYSLARSVLFERFEVDDFIDELKMSLGEALLAIHRSYLSPIREIADQSDVHGFSHITGGGIVGNTMRIIPKNLKLDIHWKTWLRPPIFQLIQKLGRVPEKEMRAAFNLGIGLVMVVSKKGTDKIFQLLEKKGEKPLLIGTVVGG
jgi:phosphoribosylformylglycinamidine cyclo-ligase